MSGRSGPVRVGRHADVPFTFRVDDVPVAGFPGETLGAAMLAGGVSAFRTAADGGARAPFCHMGTCFECVVEVDGHRVRACLTAAAPDLEVKRTDDR